jgi:hypothetical protein
VVRGRQAPPTRRPCLRTLLLHTPKCCPCKGGEPRWNRGEQARLVKTVKVQYVLAGAAGSDRRLPWLEANTTERLWGVAIDWVAGRSSEDFCRATVLQGSMYSQAMVSYPKPGGGEAATRRDAKPGGLASAGKSEPCRRDQNTCEKQASGKRRTRHLPNLRGGEMVKNHLRWCRVERFQPRLHSHQERGQRTKRIVKQGRRLPTGLQCHMMVRGGHHVAMLHGGVRRPPCGRVAGSAGRLLGATKRSFKTTTLHRGPAPDHRAATLCSTKTFLQEGPEVASRLSVEVLQSQLLLSSRSSCRRGLGLE